MNMPAHLTVCSPLAQIQLDLRELILVCLAFSESREISGRKLNSYQLNNQKVADLLIQYEIVCLSVDNLDLSPECRVSRFHNVISSANAVLETASEIMCGQIYVDGTEASRVFHRSRETLLKLRELHHAD